jgi:hypothetical protein
MLISTYEVFQKTLAETPRKGRLMPYGWYELPGTISMKWIAYSQMLGEFASELANAINHFTHRVHQLQAWASVIQPMSNDDKLKVTHEFIDSLATISVNLPYVIRSRFIFASAHLCHQANRSRTGDGWKDDLALDTEIHFAEADRHGAGWRSYNSLKRRLERIGSKSYQSATHDFRNAYNHRFSPRFVLGVTNLVTRSVNGKTGEVRYLIGGQEALDLRTVADLLVVEQGHCDRAFEAFQKLVREHTVEIDRLL